MEEVGSKTRRPLMLFDPPQPHAKVRTDTAIYEHSLGSHFSLFGLLEVLGVTPSM